jgi:transcriptional regulator PpsR
MTGSKRRVQSALPTTIEAATVMRLLGSSSDLSLVLDARGTIQEVMATERDPHWGLVIGQNLVDTVAIDSRGKVESLLSECSIVGQSRPREINLRLVEGSSSPVRLAAIRVSDDAVVAVGRDLGGVAALQQEMVIAQQAVEREYARLRQSEARFRVLFQIASDAMLLIDPSTLRVTEANTAAIRVLERAPSPVGRALPDLFASSAAVDVRATTRAVSETGEALRTDANLVTGARVSLLCSLVRGGGASALLVRIEGEAAPIDADMLRQRQVMTALEALPDAFVVIDSDRRILSANFAFCELAQLAHARQASGQSIDTWLGRPGIDVDAMMRGLSEHGAIHNQRTFVRGGAGLITDVSLSAVSALKGATPCIGLVLRALGPSAALSPPPTARSLDHIKQLVGKVPLKELVRESAELVERMCIEAALQLTSDNRASAAQLLGLSRQGLYSKLRRHGLEERR